MTHSNPLQLWRTLALALGLTACSTPASYPMPDTPPTGLATRPQHTPYTEAPEIINVNEVVEAMREAYSPYLRDAGIGGTVRIYFFIDEDGTVRNIALDESSGRRAIDDAAMEVARVYRFRPARNGDRVVPVWVSYPITFQVR